MLYSNHKQRLYILLCSTHVVAICYVLTEHVGHGLGGRRINLHAAMDQGRDRNVMSVRRPVMQKSRGNNSQWNTPAVFIGNVSTFEIGTSKKKF